jgi:hypothetical protein
LALVRRRDKNLGTLEEGVRAESRLEVEATEVVGREEVELRIVKGRGNPQG